MPSPFPGMNPYLEYPRTRYSPILIAVIFGLTAQASLALSPDEALEKKVPMPFVRFPLEKMAEYLTDATKAVFQLDPTTVPQRNIRPVTCNYRDIPLREALADLLPRYELTYEIVGGRILIKPIESLLPLSEYGYRLTQDEAFDGWISLFDGRTTFGWEGSSVEIGVLRGGASTMEFGNVELRVMFHSAGAIAIGDKRIEASKAGWMRQQIRGPAQPIRLLDGAELRQIHVKPLGLKPIFNGRDLAGWQRIDRPRQQSKPQWSVEQGALRVTGGPGALEYSDLYGDLIVQVDVRTRAAYANSGLFFRSIPGDVMNGYEAQIYNRCEENDVAQPARWSTGAIDDRQNARRLVSRDLVPFRMTVMARGPRLATWVNGYQLVDWTDTRAPHDNARQGLRLAPGTIQLQAHDPETNVEFSSILVGELQ